MLANIPRDRCGNLTSLGSVGHDHGACNPCPFWFKDVCLNGLACHHCHFIHDGQRPRRLRPSKQGRARLKKRLEPSSELVAMHQLPAQLAEAAAERGLRVATVAEQREQEEPEEQRPEEEETSPSTKMSL